MESPSDAEVIAASIDDPRAFGIIFDRYATLLRRYLVRRLGPDDAESALGETFRIAFEKRATFDQKRELARPWLYGIATNLVAKHRRGEARRLHAVARLAVQRYEATGMEDAVTSAVDAANQWDLVAEAVSSLPDGERDALVLAVWEGLSYEDVAAALDVPIGTVRSRINRARGRIRELADASGREPVNNISSRDPGRPTTRRRSGRIGS